ncbi:hypothetical protein Tco_1150927 [Tanacetum coccineum]
MAKHVQSINPPPTFDFPVQSFPPQTNVSSTRTAVAELPVVPVSMVDSKAFNITMMPLFRAIIANKPSTEMKTKHLLEMETNISIQKIDHHLEFSVSTIILNFPTTLIKDGNTFPKLSTPRSVPSIGTAVAVLSVVPVSVVDSKANII